MARCLEGPSGGLASRVRVSWALLVALFELAAETGAEAEAKAELGLGLELGAEAKGAAATLEELLLKERPRRQRAARALGEHVWPAEDCC